MNPTSSESDDMSSMWGDEQVVFRAALPTGNDSGDVDVDRDVGGFGFDDDRVGAGGFWDDADAALAPAMGAMSMAAPSLGDLKAQQRRADEGPTAPSKDLRQDFSTDVKGAKQLTALYGGPSQQLFEEVVVTAPSGGRERPLAPVPLFVEKYSSFFSATKPADIISTIASILDTLHVTHNHQPRSHKIKGMLRDGGVEIAIQAYAGEKPEECLIEFQRRCGCGLEFKRMYQACLRSLRKGSHVARLFKADFLPNVEIDECTEWLTAVEHVEQQHSITLDAAATSNLFDMATSKYVETQREASDILAHCSRTSVNVKTLLEQSNWEEVCCDLLMSKDCIVRARGAEIVANICKEQDELKALKDECTAKLNQALRDVLSTEDTFRNRQARNQATCAMERLLEAQEGLFRQSAF